MIKTFLKSLNILTENYKINIEREDITNYGIIYTPFDVVQEQLAQIPDHYFENPSLRWLDTGAGIGNYSIILFKRLYTGLAKIIVDSDERCRHIIEKMIFMIEVFPEHIKHLRKVFGENANIIDRCFLSLEKSDFQNIGFDVFDGGPAGCFWDEVSVLTWIIQQQLNGFIIVPLFFVLILDGSTVGIVLI